MKTVKKWMWAIATTIGCVAPMPGYCAEPVQYLAPAPALLAAGMQNPMPLPAAPAPSMQNSMPLPVPAVAGVQNSLPMPGVLAGGVQNGATMPGYLAGPGYLEGSVQHAYDPRATQFSYAQQTTAIGSWESESAPEPQDAPSVAAQAEACSAAAMDPCPTCESCGPVCRPIVSVEATFFWPQFSRNFLTNTLVNGLGTQTVLSDTASGSAEGGLLAAPRVTFGFQGERWGIVGRFWYAQTWGSGFTPAIPGAIVNGLTSFDAFRAYTTDLEVQRRFCWSNWDMYGFGGVRYASLKNNRLLESSNSFGLADLSTSSFASQQFNGTGFTFGFLGTRPIWCDDSPFKLFFANRYSFLWGNGGVAAQTTATLFDPLGALTSTNGAAANGQGDLFIAEVQLGFQWDACLKCLPGRAFFRTGIEYQYWNAGLGAEAGALSFATVIPSGTAAVATSDVGDVLFNMIGLNVGAGIMY